jgi:hypothetical protein
MRHGKTGQYSAGTAAGIDHECNAHPTGTQLWQCRAHRLPLRIAAPGSATVPILEGAIMKGIIFTEFIDLVAEKFGEEMVDRIIQESNLPSGGAYTAVGTYHHSEMTMVVRSLAEATSLPMTNLLKDMGEYLLSRFAIRYPQFFSSIDSTFDFLSRVEEHIHVEVRKLYPDAEFPSIICERPSENEMVLIYRSTRPLAALAEGMMMGAIAHFGETIEVTKAYCAADDTYARFVLRKS